MEKLTVQLDYEGALDVFLVVLEAQYKDLSPNIGDCPMYSFDKEKNQREFDKLEEAFKLVADYNGVKLQQKNGVNGDE